MIFKTTAQIICLLIVLNVCNSKPVDDEEKDEIKVKDVDRRKYDGKEY